MKNVISFILIAICCLTWTTIDAQTITNFTTDNGLPDNSVNCVAIDSGDRTWFGTQSGVAVYAQGNWAYYTEDDGLINDVINCIAIDDQNNVWVGTDFGVSTYDGVAWTSYTTADGLGNNWVYFVNIDEVGNVWFGTIVGLSKLDTGGAWTNYGIPEGLMSGVCYITFDDEGVKWLGTFTSGMVKFDDMEFVSFKTEDGLLNNFNILSIAIDNESNKWVGTPLGISVFDQNDQWAYNIEMTDGLFTEAVKDLLFDSQNNLWIGNYTDYLNQGAVNKFDGTNWEYFVVDEDDIIDSLISIVIRRLAVDSQDNVWVATGNGASRISNENTAISDIGFQLIKNLYPNPATDQLNIGFQSSSQTRSVEIFSLSMQMMGTYQLPANSDHMVVSLTSFSPGIYFVKLDQHMSKFIIY